MQPLRVVKVVPKLPPKLEGLWDLAYNLWFTWNDDIADIFARMDAVAWRESEQNPVRFLNNLPQSTLEEMVRDEFFLDRLNEQLDSLKRYLAKKSSYVSIPVEKRDSRKQPAVAYLSFEYGIGLCLPIYSGGLGILAGDHLKSASDLNIPLVAVGLAYRQGYFRQYMTPDGWQQERYPEYDFDALPIQAVMDEDDEQVMFDLELKDGEFIKVRVWKAQVGRVALYLLDTNFAANPEHIRRLTNRLYGGDLEMRLRQEILLGIGGIKALAKLDIAPKVIHMNEGHSAFAGLERIRRYMDEHSLTFEAAMELVASSSVFTTHTPVPAGNDRFPPDLMQPYFESYARKLGLAYKVLLAMGREDPRDDMEHFCMTVLALKLSRFSNGVSTLHGHVSRNMWKKVWPQNPVEDVPIGSITNGVHMPTWVSHDISLLFDRYLGPNWQEDPDCARIWKQAVNIPASELWRTHERLKERLVGFVRKRLRDQLMAKGARRKEVEQASEALDPQALTIGFARRFATYKRANLLLHDRERFIRLVTNKERPVQFIFAGKAHPADNGGKKLIQELIQLCRREDLRFRMVFLEDYDMKVASRMVQGCDVWLNNPRRPLEACGTSGMKAMANGVLQFSTLDGWWDEAYEFDNSVGFSIGKGEEYEDLDYQDFVESQTLYTVLEKDIVPEFYDRGHDNLPRHWIDKMKKALALLGPVYNAHRMVEDYADKAYLPAAKNYDHLTRDSFGPAKELAEWRMDIMTHWSNLKVRGIEMEKPDKVYVDEPIIIKAEVFAGSIAPDNLLVEIYHGTVGNEGTFLARSTTPMALEESKDGWCVYRGEVNPDNAGHFGFTIRVLPHHPLLSNPHSLGLVLWASE